ncbi:hypothetical protein OG840_59755 [Streptomyces sp. NBC_01764]|uniref:hypothetical protein n=1 Tax=Streptomyces sp. NBC_01764 TaxID=2975935 RepID=UPI002257048A|nr:hypothetical protein [Streptomyces sp. NBC_01764]MCX4411261.1 hypothetical protein [Streptomyces sp. NBC_01764]
MTSVGAPPHPASRRHTESSRGCTALLLPEPGRATSGPRRLFSRSIVCAARGEALPEIEVRMSISGTPGRELPGVMTAYELVAALLPAGLGAAARRERTNAGRTTINVVARLFLVLATVHKTPSAPARVALCAALTARNAAIEGDAETVDAFSRTWLGLSHPAAWRKAVEAALLGDWVEALGRGLATDDYVQALLDRHTRSEHRALQPLWERRVLGKRTALLGQPLSPGLSVQDLLTEQHTGGRGARRRAGRQPPARRVARTGPGRGRARAGLGCQRRELGPNRAGRRTIDSARRAGAPQAQAARHSLHRPGGGRQHRGDAGLTRGRPPGPWSIGPDEGSRSAVLIRPGRRSAGRPRRF